MKEHPGHGWICLWLFLILILGTVDDRTHRSLDRLNETMARIETRLDTLRERLP